MTHRPHSERPNRNRIVHRINRLGYTTMCQKDPARTLWTNDWNKATCAKCLEAKP
jgi:hypothetical protein